MVGSRLQFVRGDIIFLSKYSRQCLISTSVAVIDVEKLNSVSQGFTKVLDSLYRVSPDIYLQSDGIAVITSVSLRVLASAVVLSIDMIAVDNSMVCSSFSRLS